MQGCLTAQHSLASLDVSPEDLAGVSEIAEQLGVSRTSAARYVERPDFPHPVGKLARGRVWLRADVQAWGQANLPLKEGRPPKDS
jgi:predicted DNA-binding transcriptional regulator AlpA